MEPFALRQGAMAAALSLSETTFKEKVAQGLFPPPRLGGDGVLLYIVEECKAALYNLPVQMDAEPIVIPLVRKIK